jgi:hypothetical protein
MAHNVDLTDEPVVIDLTGLGSTFGTNPQASVEGALYALVCRRCELLASGL